MSGPIQEVNPPPNRRQSWLSATIRAERMLQATFYSAAESEGFTETSEGFTFAADIMKSQMRGTISDLKREPLKTP